MAAHHVGSWLQFIISKPVAMAAHVLTKVPLLCTGFFSLGYILVNIANVSSESSVCNFFTSMLFLLKGILYRNMVIVSRMLRVIIEFCMKLLYNGDLYFPNQLYTIVLDIVWIMSSFNLCGCGHFTV